MLITLLQTVNSGCILRYGKPRKSLGDYNGVSEQPALDVHLRGFSLRKLAPPLDYNKLSDRLSVKHKLLIKSGRGKQLIRCTSGLAPGTYLVRLVNPASPVWRPFT